MDVARSTPGVSRNFLDLELLNKELAKVDWGKTKQNALAQKSFQEGEKLDHKNINYKRNPNKTI